MGKDQMKYHTKTYKGIKWQVAFTFLFSWLCHSVSGQIHYSIVEEMRKDSAIANIANDLGIEIKQLPSKKLRVVSRVSEKYFYVSLDNGNLYVRDRIDREMLCRASPTCFLTFDAVAENPFNVFIIKLEIQDINDNAPAFYPDTFSLEITETTSPGTRFALKGALDPDIGSNSIQSYQLSDSQHFSLHENVNQDGIKIIELVLEKPLDRETQNIHKLTLTAIDGGNPVRTGAASITIIAMDANDNFPVFTKKLYKVSVYENTPVNSTIITINATDKDEGVNKKIMYSLSTTLTHSHEFNPFSINSTTGEIKIRHSIDYEVMEMYELSVEAKDGGGLVAHSKVLIEIIDANDNAPEISITSLSSPIPEDSAIGTVIAFIQVHDVDSGSNGEVDCKLEDVMEEASFHLLLSSNNYYRIVTTTDLDREKVSSYNITIVATDRGSPPLSSRRTIQLDISDVNDNPPVFTKSSYIVYIPENNLPGASISKVQADDNDTGDNAKFFYSIVEMNAKDLPLRSYLSINRETGVLYAQTSFDYELVKDVVLNVTAVDNGSPPLSSNATLTIRIVDLNDNPPKILYPSPESGGSAVFEMVPYNFEQGSLITKVVAVDADSGHNAWLSYHFIPSSEPSYFFINEHTGEIRTSRVFEEKDILKHRLVVIVKDNGDAALSATVTINLLVADSVQMVPKTSNQVNEDLPNNLQLYLVIALAIISFVFIITVMLVLISKCKQSKPALPLGSYNTNLYPTVDPRILSMYSDGTLSLPYSYDVCVALDSCQNDFTFVNSKQEVPVENLIDADDPGQSSAKTEDSSRIASQERRY